jgi:hypothetical protein
MQSKVTVTIKGQGGLGTTVIDGQAWSYMSPARRVLFLHERLRTITKGEPFDVLSERLVLHDDPKDDREAHEALSHLEQSRDAR